jgi:HD-GYP domain-containing protein (c-di-GMP phosphodiesterase class II)
MQRISVLRLTPGMIVAKNVFAADGRVLIAAGISIKQSYIRRLKELGIASVYIDSPLLPSVEVPEVVKEETRVKAITMVKNAFQNFRTTKKLDFKRFSEVAAAIVSDLICNRDTLVHLTDIRSYDDYTFAHSVNVCILAVLMGTSKCYDEYRLKELALGALLHDVGKILVPIEVLNKPGRLTAKEFDIVKEHAELGFELLRKQQDQVSLLACHVAFQHQEKYDGSGYPRQLKGTEIHEYARIVAVADVYDALTSDRPYRKGMLPHEAYEIMMASGKTHFDDELLQKFFEKIAVYPIGTIVRLNSGEVGMITEVIPELQTRPKIQLITDGNGQFIQGLEEIDLTVHLTTFIDKVFNEEETYQWLSTNKLSEPAV